MNYNPLISEPLIVALAFLGGLIPALFWLWFWLKEDKEKPEPYLLIALAFIGGMAVVPLVLPLQMLALEYYSGNNLTLALVTIEEVLKYAIALTIILWHQAVDEPIDLIIYMIAIALGFSALENALYLFNPLIDGAVTDSLITGNFRFLGASLLHVLASATVGVALALTYYKKDFIKVIAGTAGLFIAIILHHLFNSFIMKGSGSTILIVFLFVWISIIMLILLFEKIKILEAHHSSSI